MPLNGARGINRTKRMEIKNKYIKEKVVFITVKKMTSSRGSSAIEAVIVLPVFLAVFFCLMSFMRLFFIYETVQSGLSEVARGLGNWSYMYEASGLKGYGDAWEDIVSGNEEELKSQSETLLNTYDSFKGILDGFSSSGEDNQQDFFEKVYSWADKIQRTEDSLEEASSSWNEVKKLFETIAEDPAGEVKLLASVLLNKGAYAATNRLLGAYSRLNLESELKKLLDSGNLENTLFIKGGASGLDFTASDFLGDGQSLDLIVSYTVRIPSPFGLMPEVKLCNRVKVFAWFGGSGASVKSTSPNGTQTTGSSIWITADKENRFFERGLEIEKGETAKLREDAEARGYTFFEFEKRTPAVDAAIVDELGKTVVLYDVFSINPFLDTYRTNGNKIKQSVLQHAVSLMAVEQPLGLEGSYGIHRIILIVMPENTPDWVLPYVEEARKAALSKGISDVRLVKAYGKYE